MYVVLIAGGIASGKSSVARQLEGLGCVRIDLDALSREVCLPGSPTLAEIACAFGTDVLDADGALRRDVLARRAFADEPSCARLEQIVHPAVERLALERIDACAETDVVVVEVPLLDRVEALRARADEVCVVTCPLEVREVRACERGMDVDDFYARVALQPTDDYLRSCADTVFDNAGGPEELCRAVMTWYETLRADGVRRKD